MKKNILALLLFTNFAAADCDTSTGIVKNDNGSYIYSRDCHIWVGQQKQDLEIANKQNEKLTQALDLKDLAITKADQRADLWMNTSFKLEDRINAIDKMQSSNGYLAFGLGVLSVFAAGYAANQIYRH